MKKMMTVLYVVFAFLLSACGGGGSDSPQVVAPPAPAPIFNFDGTITMAQYVADFDPQNRIWNAGNYQVNTGAWGLTSADHYTERMSGNIDPNTNIANFLSEWDVTQSKTPGVVLFTNITYGLHPGFNKSSTAKLPVKIDSMPNQILSAEVKTTCLTSCVYGTALDVFLMSSNKVDNHDIGTEILIVTERTHDDPVKFDGDVTINGVKYLVVHNGFGSNWNTIQYFPPKATPITSLNINVKDFIDDSAKRGWINPTDYLVSIEFGTEVTWGLGTTSVKNFTIN